MICQGAVECNSFLSYFIFIKSVEYLQMLLIIFAGIFINCCFCQPYDNYYSYKQSNNKPVINAWDSIIQQLDNFVFNRPVQRTHDCNTGVFNINEEVFEDVRACQKQNPSFRRDCLLHQLPDSMNDLREFIQLDGYNISQIDVMMSNDYSGIDSINNELIYKLTVIMCSNNSNEIVTSQGLFPHFQSLHLPTFHSIANTIGSQSNSGSYASGVSTTVHRSSFDSDNMHDCASRTFNLTEEGYQVAEKCLKYDSFSKCETNPDRSYTEMLQYASQPGHKIAERGFVKTSQALNGVIQHNHKIRLVRCMVD